MNILLSGGSGYIGSNILTKLTDLGIKVGVLGRTSALAVQSDLITFYQADITQPITIELAQQYDTFIHLAAANDVDSLDPKTAMLATVLGTKNCLEFCKKAGINKFIYFSTFQVYGRVSGYMDEESICEPGNDYGLTHLFAEDYVRMYSRTSNVKYVIVRPTNIYGAPATKGIDRWTLVPNCFCQEAFENQSITLMSSGKQKRDFIDLNELSDITIELCRSFGRFENKIVNGASGNDFTIVEIAEIVKDEYQKMFGKTCEVIIKSPNPTESNIYEINTRVAKSVGVKSMGKDSIRKEIQDIFGLLN